MTEEQLEKEIDAVGRDKVFAYAEQLGWKRGSTPPLWVWAGIVSELKSNLVRTHA